MRLGDLKPKGSDMTFDEWVDMCRNHGECADCPNRKACETHFASIIIYNVADLFDCEIEQKPKKPKIEKDDKDMFGIMCGNCPTCDNAVYSTANKYCHNCGQVLDWSDDK